MTQLLSKACRRTPSCFVYNILIPSVRPLMILDTTTEWIYLVYALSVKQAIKFKSVLKKAIGDFRYSDPMDKSIN